MTHISNGLSPAGQRIFQAGLAFQREQGERDRSAFTRAELSALIAKREREQAMADRKAEADRKRIEAIQKALDSSEYSYVHDGAVHQGPTMREIIEETAAWHGFTHMDLCSAGKQRLLVYARHEAMWRCASETLHSLPKIGRALGGRDHTTVIHGIRAHAKRNDVPLPRGMTAGTK